MEPTISVVTISFNDVSGLRRTRESVVAQRGVKINHIIVDGGSTDGTRAFLTTLHDVDWSSSSDNGRYDAMNRGIERSTTDLIWLMHAGDTFGDDDCVAKVMRSYAKEKWSWAYGFSRILNPEGAMIALGGFAPFDIRRLALGTQVVPHQATIFERWLHQQVAGYSVEFGLAADQLYLLKAAKLKAPFVIGEFLCNFDGQGAGSTRGSWAHFADMVRARRLAGVSVSGSYLADGILTLSLFLITVSKTAARNFLTKSKDNSPQGYPSEPTTLV
jgi:glycosyltransferase involved in cell wall biosynthesis